MFLQELSEYSLQSLRIFSYTASMGSLSEAAQALGLTQPALSLQIQNLEKHLGFELFERQGRRNVLTPRGQAFLRKIVPLLEALDRTLTDIKEESSEKRPKIFLGAVEGIGEFWLASRLPKFSKFLGKDLRYMMEIAEGEDLESYLLTGRLNVVVTPSKITNPRVVSQVFMEEELVPVGTKAQVERLEKALKAKNKGNQRVWEEFLWIGNEDSKHPDKWAVRWFESIGYLVDRRFKFFHRVNSYPVISSLLLQGDTLAILPRHTVEEHIESGKLVALDSKTFPPLTNQMYLSYRQGSLNELHQTFIDWLLKESL
jgi:DNA-binding transcriptional LysR family regulator